ncbi:disulfide bond formation protein B [Novosphingobium piscinae]|uniref:Disulfide bond formation protein B n=1 Tax=Novosphingobium piscinae TaxID=1507448 RepID=A0A7X1KRG8_9SPHN|nr:disulfide bond formation protein B [Novosphingobium piscinae]MBC2670799.1 disulfide bond formation protein B [Novosphingobium piscinae]
MPTSGSAALRLARWLALLVPAALLGGAYLSQYGFGLYPCEMCWWQRYPHAIALALAALGLAVPGARWPVVLAAVAIAVSGLIGGYHAGVEYHWWEGVTRCTSTAAPGGNVLEAILDAPLIRCDQAQWTLFGISLAGFNFLFSIAGAALIGVFLARSQRT